MALEWPCTKAIKFKADRSGVLFFIYTKCRYMGKTFKHIFSKATGLIWKEYGTTFTLATLYQSCSFFYPSETWPQGSGVSFFYTLIGKSKNIVLSETTGLFDQKHGLRQSGLCFS